MKTIGIIAEFNPLHSGHRYMIQKAREISGADCVAVVMSGDFVQRGEPAVVDKYLRTQMALSAGADLLLELPCAAASGSAGEFAGGAVSVLEAAGLIDELWFGSECGSIDPFLCLAEYLAEEPEDFSAVLREELAAGRSYPSARAEAVRKCLSGPENAGKCLFGPEGAPEQLLEGPNNILGLEYCIALKKRGSAIRPCTLKRRGAGYHEGGTDTEYASAEAIRGVLAGGGEIPEDQIPPVTRALLQTARRNGGLIVSDDFSDMLFYQLVRYSASQIAEHFAMTEELANRILEQSRYTASISELTERVKAKNYTWTQVSRALTRITLQISREDRIRAQNPAAVRVLGVKDGKDGGALLGRLAASAKVPVFTGAKEIAPEYYTRDLFASHLYERVLVKKTGVPFRHEYTRRLVKG